MNLHVAFQARQHQNLIRTNSYNISVFLFFAAYSFLVILVISFLAKRSLL
jgi:hypothetical protein